MKKEKFILVTVILIIFLMQSVWGGFQTIEAVPQTGLTIVHEGGLIQLTSPQSPYIGSVSGSNQISITITDFTIKAPQSVVCGVTPGQVLVSGHVINEHPTEWTTGSGPLLIRDDGKRFWGIFYTFAPGWEDDFELPILAYFFRNGEPLFECEHFPIERVYTFYLWNDDPVFFSNAEIIGSFEIEVTGGTPPVPICGDGVCSKEFADYPEFNEYCWSCSEDCGSCPGLLEPILECRNDDGSTSGQELKKKKTTIRRTSTVQPKAIKIKTDFGSLCPVDPNALLVPIQSVLDPINYDTGAFQCGYDEELNVCPLGSTASVNVCAIAPTGCAYVGQYALFSAAFVLGTFLVYAEEIYTMIYHYVPYTPFRDLWYSDFYLDREYNRYIDDFITSGAMPPNTGRDDFGDRCKRAFRDGTKYFDKQYSRPASIQTINSTHIYTSTNKGKLWRCKPLSNNEYTRGLETGRFVPMAG